MNYDDWKVAFIKENRKLKIAIAFTLVISSLTSLSIFFQKKYYLYKGGEIFEERPLAEEVCRLAFIGLTKGEPNPYVVSDDIIDIVQKSPFDVHIDKVLKLESLEKGSCKIIIKSQEELLAFKIGLEESRFYPFHYKLIQIDELSTSQVM